LKHHVDGADMKKTALVLTLALLLSAIAVESQIVNLANAQHSIVSVQILQQREVAITINDDGSIEGTSQIQRNLNTYTFVGNISGNIQVRKSNIVIDGAGFTLNGNNGTGIAISSEATEHPSELDIWNVTVRNLRITNFKWGIRCDFGGNHTFYGNYISNDFVTQNGTGNFSWDNLGILFWGGSGNNITHCTIGGSPAIYMHFVCSNNVVTENNIIFGADLRISGIETFDGNYWSDYSIRYPNASELDSTGMWNMPYVFADSSNFENRQFQDNHPLVNPIIIPNFSSLPKIQSPSQTTEPTSTPQAEKQQTGFLGTNLPLEYGYAIVAVLAAVVIGASVLVYLKKLPRLFFSL